MSRNVIALAAIYGACCLAASLGIAMMFGTAAQLIAVPLFFIGGVLLGRAVS